MKKNACLNVINKYMDSNKYKCVSHCERLSNPAYINDASVERSEHMVLSTENVLDE